MCELHDCFAQNELISYEALGFCDEGEAEAFVERGDNSYGGKVVTNPSGGLLSKGHPLGATGLAQCHELVQQLRGAAGLRQVPDARLALQHNVGLGGACVVTLVRGGVAGTIVHCEASGLDVLPRRERADDAYCAGRGHAGRRRIRSRRCAADVAARRSCVAGR